MEVVAVDGHPAQDIWAVFRFFGDPIHPPNWRHAKKFSNPDCNAMKKTKITFAALMLAGMFGLASAVPPPPGPPPDAPPVKFCGKERPHKPHDWRGPEGKLFHCLGKE